MATTFTLNIPDDLYERLKESAEIHRRSVNSEAIACLEVALQPHKSSPAERLQRIRQLRNTLPQKGFRARDVAAMRRQGRR